MLSLAVLAIFVKTDSGVEYYLEATNIGLNDINSYIHLTLSCTLLCVVISAVQDA